MGNTVSNVLQNVLASATKRVQVDTPADRQRQQTLRQLIDNVHAALLSFEFQYNQFNSRYESLTLATKLDTFFKQIFDVKRAVDQLYALNSDCTVSSPKFPSPVHVTELKQLVDARVTLYNTALTQVKIVIDLFEVFDKFQNRSFDKVDKIVSAALLEYVTLPFQQKQQHFNERQAFITLNFLIRKWKEFAELPAFVRVADAIAKSVPQEQKVEAFDQLLTETQQYLENARKTLSPLTAVVDEDLKMTLTKRENELMRIKLACGKRCTDNKPILLFVTTHGQIPTKNLRMLTFKLPPNVSVGKMSAALPGYSHYGTLCDQSIDSVFTQLKTFYNSNTASNITLPTLQPILKTLKQSQNCVDQQDLHTVFHTVPEQIMNTNYTMMRYLPRQTMLEKEYFGNGRATDQSVDWQITILADGEEHILLTKKGESMSLSKCIDYVVKNHSDSPLVDIILVDMSCACYDDLNFIKRRTQKIRQRKTKKTRQRKNQETQETRKRKREVAESRYDDYSEEAYRELTTGALERGLAGGIHRPIYAPL